MDGFKVRRYLGLINRLSLADSTEAELTLRTLN